MKRDLKKMSNTEYDVVIVGAGIYGVNTAWDAVLRGLKVALIDMGDFGSATSSNSLKIIHGGLRYLQQLDLKRMRESIHERMILMKIAPHLVYPMPVVMPTYANKMKSRPAMFAAMIANDIVGIDRNQLKDPHKYMPNGKIISINELREYIPDYEKYNMSGGAMWYDCQCYNTERLLLSFVLSAAEKGADIANYVKADGLIKEGNKIIGVKAKDMLTGETFDLRAKVVVNNSGPWVDRVISDLYQTPPPTRRFQLSTAMNLVVKRKLLSSHAAGISAPYHYKFDDGSEYNAYRMLFYAPWRDYTIIGTNHLVYKGKQDEYKVTEAEIQDFLAAVNTGYSAAHIKREEVTYFYGGFLPMARQNPKTGDVGLLKHYAIHDHAIEDKVDGLISVVGVKYTTARDVGMKTVNIVFDKMNKKAPESKTEDIPIHGGEIDMFEDFMQNAVRSKNGKLTEPTMKHLSYNYGSTYSEVLEYGKQDAKWLERMPNSKEVLKAEVLHGVKKEMAMKLQDIILRRTDLGSGENPGQECLKEAAQIMGNELNWSQERIKAEIEETNNIYVPA